MECKAVYKGKIETGFKSGDIRDVWEGLKLAVNFNDKPSNVGSDINVDDLNVFYARFDGMDFSEEVTNLRNELTRSVNTDDIIEINEEQVRREFSKVNERKAVGPDGIKGKI